MSSALKKRDIYAEELGDAAGFDNTQPANTLGALTFTKLERPVKMIPLAKIIRSSSTQTRTVTFDPQTISEDAELLESIKAKGVLEPVMVFPILKPGDQSPAFGNHCDYQLVFGHRRVEASRAAGLEYIPASVAKDRVEASELTITENTGTRLLTSYERAMSLMKLKEEFPTQSLADLAAKCGVPTSTAYRFSRILERSPQPLLSLFGKGLDDSIASSLVAVFESVPENKQQDFAGKVASISRRQSEQLASAVKMGADPFEALGMVGLEFSYSAKANEPIKVVSVGDAQEPPVKRESPEKCRTTEEPEKKPAQFVLDPNLDPENAQTVEFYVSLSGLNKAQIRKLITEASEQNRSTLELVLTLRLVGAGLPVKEAVSGSADLLSNKVVAGILKPYLDSLFRAKAAEKLLNTTNPDLFHNVSLILYGNAGKEKGQ